jgi:hypothetical protein
VVLFKFRQTFNCEWHDNIGTITLNNQWVKASLANELNKLIGEINAIHNNKDLMNQANILQNQIFSISNTEKRNISPLRIAEMMEIIVFKMNSIKPGTYSGTWKKVFEQNCNIDNAAIEWFDFVASFGSRERFFNHLLTSSADPRDLHFKYVLLEHESVQYNNNIHFKQMDMEHIFSDESIAIAHNMQDYGFTDSNEYHIFCQTLGNKIFIDSGLNRSIKAEQLSVKANSYKNQRFSNTIVPQENQSQSSIALGDVLLHISNKSHYKFYLMLRRLEIILFALRRF